VGWRAMPRPGRRSASLGWVARCRCGHRTSVSGCWTCPRSRLRGKPCAIRVQRSHGARRHHRTYTRRERARSPARRSRPCSAPPRAPTPSQCPPGTPQGPSPPPTHLPGTPMSSFGPRSRSPQRLHSAKGSPVGVSRLTHACRPSRQRSPLAIWCLLGPSVLGTGGAVHLLPPLSSADVAPCMRGPIRGRSGPGAFVQCTIVSSY
jgi:hypothetical protein